MDVHSPRVRSYNMSQIKSKDTKPEALVRKYLFSQGFRYRKNDKRLPGCPDIVLPKYRTVVLINGCFWHAHEGCKYFVMTRTNTEFWNSKISGNVERDKKVICDLKNGGWNVIVIWECQIKPKQRDNTLSLLCEEIKHNITENER